MSNLLDLPPGIFLGVPPPSDMPLALPPVPPPEPPVISGAPGGSIAPTSVIGSHIEDPDDDGRSSVGSVSSSGVGGSSVVSIDPKRTLEDWDRRWMGPGGSPHMLGWVSRVYRFFVPARHVPFTVEVEAHGLLADIEIEPNYPYVLPDPEQTDVWLDAEEGNTEVVWEPDVGGKLNMGRVVVKKERVRRSRGRHFVSKWVAWGKAEFPGAYRSSNAVDRICIEQRLCKKMREQHVRDHDIAMFKGRVVVGIFTPSRAEVEEQQLFASTVIGDRCRRGMDVKPSWLGWLTGRGGKRWVK